MKKIHLLSLLLALTTTVSAQKQKTPLPLSDHITLKSNGLSSHMQVMAPRKGNLSKAPAGAGGTIIWDQPEGTLKQYVFNGSGFAVYNTAPMEFNASDWVADVVEGTDGYIYFRQPVMGLNIDTWIKLEKTSETTLVAHPQPLCSFIDNTGAVQTFYITDMEFRLDDTGTQGLFYATDEGDINFEIDNGTISYVPAGGLTVGSGSNRTYIPNLFGVVDSNNDWAGYGDYENVRVPTSEEPVMVPDGLAQNLYLVNNDKGSRTYYPLESRYLIRVAFDGDDAYFSHFPNLQEHIAFKATKKDGKYVVPAGQYLGGDTYLGAFFYAYKAGSRPVYDEDMKVYYDEDILYKDEDIVIDFDEATRIFACADTFHVNKGSARANGSAIFGKTQIVPFEVKGGKPKAPFDLELTECTDETTGKLTFSMPMEDVDGNYLVPDSLYWRAWIQMDGEEPEVWVFHNDEYDLPIDDVTEIPFGWYTSVSDITTFNLTQTFKIFSQGITRWGAQSVYIIGDKEYDSDITWTGTTSDIATTSSYKQVATVSYTDMAGRQTVRPRKGVYLQVTTFTDGTRSCRKVVKK